MAMSPELEKLYKGRLIARLEKEDADAAKSWAGEGNYVPKFDRSRAEGLSYADLVKEWGGDDSGWGRPDQNSAVDDNDPANAAFRERFGAGDFKNVELQNTPLGNNLNFSYTKPTWFDDGSQDKSRIMQLPDGRWVWEANNLSGDYVQRKNAESDDSGFFHGDAMDVVKVAAFFAAAIGGAALLEGAGAAETAGATQLSGPGSTMTGVTPGVEAATGLETAGAGAGNAAGTVSTDGMWELPGEGATPPPSGTPTPSPAPAPGGEGFLRSAANSVLDAGKGAYNWYNNLSPAARQVLGSAVSFGARAALQNSAQQAAQQARTDAENRARDDKIRRGQVTAVAPGTYTPRPLPGGLIASQTNNNRGG